MRMKETSFLGLDNFDNPAFEASPSPSVSTAVDLDMNAIMPISPSSDAAMEASNNLSKQPLALSVRGAYKSYQKGTPVLENLNMSVPTGCIYSLLGSSGCGKSTLLACCVGIGNLNKGEILMYGYQPGSKESGVPGRRVGYMPQDLSLYGELKIREAFNFYGRIYGMNGEQIEESSKFLIEFLDLPEHTRRIGTLSGGQKRRVSFSIALLHCPQLLILDEPTVGVDALLRENIWNYLVKLVNTDGTTVIITTHYIEESRQSNLIGIMRNGRLLEEKSPQLLLDEYDVTLLEDIVLALCRQDLEERKRKKGQIVEEEKQINTVEGDAKKGKRDVFQTRYEGDGMGNTNSPEMDQRTLSLNRNRQDFPVDQQTSFFQKAAAVLIKNFIVMMRNLGFLAFIFFIPALQMVLISLAIGSDPKDLHVGVVNGESCDFESENWRQILLEECPLSHTQGGTESLSCFYLAGLPKETFHLIRENSEADALSRVSQGHIYGFVNFPPNFTLNVECRVGGVLLGECGDLSEVKTNSKISYSLDMSSKPIGQTMKRMFVETYSKTMSKVSTNCNSSMIATLLYELASDLPYHFNSPIYGKDDTSFKDFLAPSVLLALLFFFPLCSSGVTYIAEKKSGTLDRALVAGIGTTEFMCGYLLIQVVILLGQTGISFLILSLVFNLEIVGSVALALFLTVLVGISGMSAGFLIAVFCSDEFQAVLLAMGTFFPNVLLAGVIWPPEGMVKALQYISYFLPCTWACESMRSIVSRGWGITHRDVWPGFLSTLTWTVVYWILTVVVHRIKHKM